MWTMWGDFWDTRNQLLDELEATIQQRTQGRLRNLSLDDVNGMITMEADTATYYGVQLALAAVAAFSAQRPRMTPSRLLFRVDGHPFVLHNRIAQYAYERERELDASSNGCGCAFARLSPDEHSSSAAPKLPAMSAR
jgi:hypothetical protein